MNPAAVAKWLNVAPDTIRRWTKDYKDYLTADARPGQGRTRAFADHDLAVLIFIAGQRELGMDGHTIRDRLEEMRSNGWAGLPPVPQEWYGEATMPVAHAASRAGELAQLAAMQTELQYTRQALEAAEKRTSELTAQLTTLEGSHTATTDELHAARLELERARGEVATLRAQLAAYRLGGDRPVAPLVLIAAVALVSMAAVLLIVLIMLVMN